MGTQVGSYGGKRAAWRLFSCETWVRPFEGFNRPERSERVGQLSAEILAHRFRFVLQ